LDELAVAFFNQSLFFARGDERLYMFFGSWGLVDLFLAAEIQ